MKNLEQAIVKYVESKRGCWSDSTMRTALPKLNTINLYGFEPNRLYTSLRDKGFNDYTIKTYFDIASKFENQVLKTSRIRTWIQDHRLKFKNCYKTKTQRITKEQYESYLKQVENDSDMYNFLILTGKFGLRKSEAFQVKWSDFNSDGDLVVWKGKGNKMRTIPFDKKLLKRNQLMKNTYTILPSDLKYWNFFSKCPFTPHDFRSYAITSWNRDCGFDLAEAAQIAGHSDINTTHKYIRNDLDSIREKGKKL